MQSPTPSTHCGPNRPHPSAAHLALAVVIVHDDARVDGAVLRKHGLQLVLGDGCVNKAEDGGSSKEGIGTLDATGADRAGEQGCN